MWNEQEVPPEDSRKNKENKRMEVTPNSDGGLNVRGETGSE